MFNKKSLIFLITGLLFCVIASNNTTLLCETFDIINGCIVHKEIIDIPNL